MRAANDNDMRTNDFSLISAADIMIRQVLTVDQSTVVLEATKKMAALNVGSVVIVDQARKVLGIFTERDVVIRVVACGKDPATTVLSTVMTANPIILSSDIKIVDAFEIMQKQGMRHLLFGGNAILEGILSIKDINKVLFLILESAFGELREAIRQLVDAEQMNALGEFAGGMTHELNQPLNIAKIICQSMLRDIQKDRFSTQEALNDLPEIVNQMNRMSEAVAHLSVFSRSKAKTAPRANDINALIGNVFTMHTTAI